jgi:hypothetical protein
MSRAEQVSAQPRGAQVVAAPQGAVAAPDERQGRFVELSAFLTGYGRVRLIGTGLISTYLQTLDEVLPAGVLDELLGAFARLPSGADREAGAATGILDDAKLGPVARNVILLWYCGTWTELSQAWHATHGASPRDTTHVVSAAAYAGGLQWTAAGAHPAGARQQGFGAWAQAPGEGRG